MILTMSSHAIRLGIFVAAALAAGGCRDAGAKGAEDGIFGELTVVAAPAAPGSAEANLVTGPDGRVYLSWIEPGPDSTHALRYSTLEGAGWSAPKTVAGGR